MVLDGFKPCPSANTLVGVVLSAVIPCLEVSLLLIFSGSDMFRTVLLELLQIPPNSHMSHPC